MSLLARIPHIRGHRSTKFALYPELTNYCNFKCIYCPHSQYRQESAGGNKFNREKGYMSDELWDLVLENAAKYAKYIGLGFFGESLLHPSFLRLIERIPNDHHYGLVIFTNWSLVTKEHIETLKRFNCVVISLDASNAALYEKLCPGGAVLDLNGETSHDRYDTIVEKIQYWFNLSDHAPTQLCYVISSVNKHDVEDFVNKWCLIIGDQDYVVTKTILSYGGIMKDRYMSNCDCNIFSSHPFIVGWNGDCSPCNLDVNIAWNVGNLFEAKDIKRIINGDTWRQTISKIRCKEGICANCHDANNRPKDTFYKRKNS